MPQETDVCVNYICQNTPWLSGMWYPKIYLQVEPDKIEKIEKFEAHPEDIWLCSYPKSGKKFNEYMISAKLNILEES